MWTKNFQIHNLGLEKAEGQEIKLPTFAGSQRTHGSSRKLSTSVSLITRKTLVNHNKLWEVLKEMGIPDHIIYLLRNLYVGPEATVRTGHGTIDWFKIGKGVRQGCRLSPCLFNLYAEYIMWNTRLDKLQAGIKIARRHINNLRYTDDVTLIVESEKELKSLLMKVKEESGKAGLKLNIQKMKIMASGPISSWQIDGETMETVAYFIFSGSQITVNSNCCHEIKRCLKE